VCKWITQELGRNEERFATSSDRILKLVEGEEEVTKEGGSYKACCFVFERKDQ